MTESGEDEAKNSSLMPSGKIHVLVEDTNKKEFTRRYGGSDDQSIDTTQIRSVKGPRINQVDDAQCVSRVYVTYSNVSHTRHDPCHTEPSSVRRDA